MKQYSQHGQDKYLNELINKKNGFFIDIGAHDGISYSNSYVFEIELGWNGICIEPLPGVFSQLQKNRKCIVENCAISNIEGLLDFVSISGPKDSGEMFSGFNRKEIAESIHRPYEIIKVNSFRLDTILNKHNIKHADFCSIDTETTEFDVIKSINWNDYQIDYICIEKNNNEQQIIDYLKTYRYEFIKDAFGDIILKKYN
jgi:FkbM family methyltransferase